MSLKSVVDISESESEKTGVSITRVNPSPPPLSLFLHSLATGVFLKTEKIFLFFLYTLSYKMSESEKKVRVN